MGSVIKVLAVYDHPFWREDGLSGEGFAPYQLVREVYDNTPPGRRAGRARDMHMEGAIRSGRAAALALLETR